MTLQPGTHVGGYEIVGPLGSGGMGEVYRARDVVLQRDVALKVLGDEVRGDPAHTLRLLAEARAASALNHPNVITVHAVGTGDADAPPFIVSELIEGETLRARLARGPLRPAEVIDVARQVLAGLGRAHAAGLVHRDLKPENLMMTPDGRLKILDFGLATRPAGAGTGLTGTGLIAGTAAYMSPEQARGLALDGRSDLFSLGAVLYELLTGQSPFRRATLADTLAAVLNEPPTPLATCAPGVPAGLAAVVDRALARDPSARFDSAAGMEAALRDVATDTSQATRELTMATARSHPRRRRGMLAAAFLLLVLAAIGLAVAVRRPGKPAEGQARALAVLPFDTLGGGADERVMGDGVAEAITTELVRLRDVSVIARGSAEAYRGRPLAEVASGLHVGYVLQGTVQRAGDRLRVTAALVEPASGRQVWADRYDGRVDDVFGVQDEIASRVAAALRATLAPPDTSPASRPATVQSYERYLRARSELVSKGPGNVEAIALLQQVTADDPGFARGWSALAVAYGGAAFMRGASAYEGPGQAAADTALRLDPSLGEAYLARARFQWTREHGFPHEQVLAEVARALSMEPQLASAYLTLGDVYLHVGMIEEAAPMLRRAAELDPVALRPRLVRARVAALQGHVDEALGLVTDIPLERARVLAGAGRTEEARRALAQAPVRDERGLGSYDVLAIEARLAASRGDAAEVERLTREVRAHSAESHFHHAAYDIALAWAALGRAREAAEWLKVTADTGMPAVAVFEHDPVLARIRATPEMQTVMTGLQAEDARRRAAIAAIPALAALRPSMDASR